MLKFLQYGLPLAIGFFACAIILRRGGPGSEADWENKYRNLHERFRDLTRQLKGAEERGELKSNRLRQTLIEVATILREGSRHGSSSASEALAKIENSLKEV